ASSRDCELDAGVPEFADIGFEMLERRCAACRHVQVPSDRLKQLSGLRAIGAGPTTGSADSTRVSYAISDFRSRLSDRTSARLTKLTSPKRPVCQGHLHRRALKQSLGAAYCVV